MVLDAIVIRMVGELHALDVPDVVRQGVDHPSVDAVLETERLCQYERVVIGMDCYCG